MCPEYESNAQSFHIMHFPPIENHYKEKFNVSGLLNEDSDMKKELLNHNSFIIERIFVCYVRTVFSVCFIHTVIFVRYYCNKNTDCDMKRPNSV